MYTYTTSLEVDCHKMYTKATTKVTKERVITSKLKK